MDNSHHNQEPPTNWHLPPEHLFKEERDELLKSSEEILSAWRVVGASKQGDAIKKWLTEQVLKPVGPDTSHTYYAGTQDAFKTILAIMKPETKK